jgi:cyclopropane fatty-acyl-phospholipid synthase-like methyltransferase
VHDDEAAARARQRGLVRRGYDAVSGAYRDDDGRSAGTEDTSRYAGWAAELEERLRPGARVLDLGCGAGIPATRELTDRGLQVIGVDFSAAQLHRARRLVPDARLVQADMATVQFGPASLDAVVSFYAVIHLPLSDQRALFPRIRHWLRPAGLFLAIVGAQPWTGTERFHGAEMFWEHAGTDSYLGWLAEARLTPLWDRFVPEGEAGGHSLILAWAC